MQTRSQHLYSLEGAEVRSHREYQAVASVLGFEAASLMIQLRDHGLQPRVYGSEFFCGVDYERALMAVSLASRAAHCARRGKPSLVHPDEAHAR